VQHSLIPFAGGLCAKTSGCQTAGPVYGHPQEPGKPPHLSINASYGLHLYSHFLLHFCAAFVTRYFRGFTHVKFVDAA